MDAEPTRYGRRGPVSPLLNLAVHPGANRLTLRDVRPVDHGRNPYPVSRTYANLLPIESIGKTGCPVDTSPTLRGVDGLSDSQAWYTIHRDFSQLLRTRHRVGERMDDNASPGL